jgi:hypothetical protein
MGRTELGRDGEPVNVEGKESSAPPRFLPGAP